MGRLLPRARHIYLRVMTKGTVTEAKMSSESQETYKGEQGKMGHVLYGTNTITKKVISVCQYKN